jgi:multiple sugar transport system ATP-binding protein
MASVGLEHVSKRFGDVIAVDDLSLEIPDGEFLVIVGPSGCGKTTALRIIAGLEMPDSGTVRIGGEVVNDVAPRDRNVAMVFEDYALYPHMAVRDNLSFPLQMRQTPAEEIRRRVAEVSESMELDPLLERKPGKLATGEAQSVAVGHAVVRETPSVFLLDDALAHLDAHQRLEARAELGRLHRELGTTIVSVTHDQAEAQAVGTHVAVMEAGVLRQNGTPRELYEEPADAFVAGFIGNPPMNLLEMTLERDGDGWVLRRGPLAWPAPAWLPDAGRSPHSPVTVGLRHEHIHVGTPATDGEVAFEGSCEHIEYLGHQLLIHLRAGDTELVASDDPARHIGVGDVVTCSASPDRLYLFDAESGAAMRAR